MRSTLLSLEKPSFDFSLNYTVILAASGIIMSILRCFLVQTFFILISLICHTMSFSWWSTTPPTTTTSTIKPFTRTPGLSLPVRNFHPPKCSREVPAILFKYEKDVEIRGNSTINPYFNLIEVCCEGYKRYDFDWSKCVPDCGDKCANNGFCTDGGICECFNEYVLNHRNECVPTCPLQCPNGQCYLNGTCICDHGYELDGTKKYCIPRCEFGCAHNEYCAAPNRCQCEVGYAKAIPDLGMGCQPICIPDCGFGHCVGPNQCECFKGYEKRANGTVCDTFNYMRCDNGLRVDLYTCRCHNGYKYDNVTTTCLPDCDDCENGVCISPGVCRCYNGYERLGSKCVAICERGCGYNGYCIAPNVCGCALSDGPFKSFQQCENGSCTSRGRCRCNENTERYINTCLPPGMINTYNSKYKEKLNQTLVDEFNLLIGQYFMFMPTHFLKQSEFAGFGVVY